MKQLIYVNTKANFITPEAKMIIHNSFVKVKVEDIKSGKYNEYIMTTKTCNGLKSQKKFYIENFQDVNALGNNTREIFDNIYLYDKGDLEEAKLVFKMLNSISTKNKLVGKTALIMEKEKLIAGGNGFVGYMVTKDQEKKINSIESKTYREYKNECIANKDKKGLQEIINSFEDYLKERYDKEDIFNPQKFDCQIFDNLPEMEITNKPSLGKIIKGWISKKRSSKK